MSLTKCQSIAIKLPQSTVDELLSRIDDLMGNGMTQDRAQVVAANDMLRSVEAERASILEAIAEQHPETLETPDKPKIEDFGEKIGGARKDYAAKLAEAIDSDIAAVPLSQSWPEPDYQKLLDGGADPWAVAFMHAARDEVPNKPGSSWKLQRWVAHVENLRDTTLALANNELSVERAKKLLAESKTLQPIADRVTLYMEVGHTKSLKGVRVRVGEYSLYNKVEYKPPKVIWSVEVSAPRTAMSNWPNMIGTGDTKAEAIDNFKKAWLATTPEQDAKKAINFQIYSKTGTKEIFIGKKIGSNVAELKGGFASAKEARAWMDGNQAELVILLEKYKTVPYERKETNSPRVGIDHRDGANVTPQQFYDAFGFRGVQFGNYVEGDRRQQDLNEAYDALMDLAGILDIPSKAISLNGELGLAFGARGTGGKKAPSAHYEPGEVVINLTKARGAGSLAHEWFHAVDNYFSRMSGEKAKYLTETQAVKSGVRTEMVDAFKRVMQAIQSTELRKRSVRLDNTRSKPYWQTKLEMAARSFESYIVAKLQDQGASNDYLANIVSEEYWKAATALGMEKDSTFPYPKTDEMTPIRAAFDHFFQTVETKETDRGVAMFNRPKYDRGPKRESVHIDDLRALSKAIKMAYPIRPAASISEWPADLRKLVEDAPHNEGIDAAFWNGEIWLAGDRLTDLDTATNRILHEGAHGGLRGLFGDRLDAQLIRIHQGNPMVRERVAGMREDMPKLSIVEATEEVLVIMSADGEAKNLKGWDRFVAWIRSWLRSHGFGGAFADNFTDNDVLYLLQRAASVAEGRRAGKEQYAGYSAFSTVRDAFHRAWHGSPHDFDEFDLGKIGTGEGNQVYGYGLYFAGKREVAEWYQRGLSGLMIEGQLRTYAQGGRGNSPGVGGNIDDDPKALAVWRLFSDLNTTGRLSKTDSAEMLMADADKYRVPDFLGDGKAMLGGYRFEPFDKDRDAYHIYFGRQHRGATMRGGLKAAIQYIKESDPSLEKRAAHFEAAAKYLQGLPEDEIRAAGKLYQVDIAPSEGDYLDWDRPMSQQSAKVKKSLTDQLAIRVSEKDTGQDVYRRLSGQVGSDENASNRLRDLGVPGIRYLDGSSRNKNTVVWKDGADPSKYDRLTKGVAENYLTDRGDVADAIARLKRDAEASGARQYADAAKALENGDLYLDLNHNYVIFDDSLVKVEAKFSRGDPQNPDGRFSRGGGSSSNQQATSRASWSVDDAKAHWDNLTAGFKNLPRVNFLNGVRQAPDNLLKQIRAAKAENTVLGAYHQGEVFIFSDNIPDLETMERFVAQHELRHYGMEGKYGNQLRAALLNLRDMNPELKSEADALKAKYSDLDDSAAVNEVLANKPLDYAQKLGGWKRFKANLRAWLTAHGYKRLARLFDGPTADEITRDFLYQAEAFYKGKAKSETTHLYETNFGRNNTPSATNSKTGDGVPQGGMQERAVRADETGSPELAQESAAGGRQNLSSLEDALQAFRESQPVDRYEYDRKFKDIKQEVERDWANGNSDEYSRTYGPDEIHADLKNENAAEYYAEDGDLTGKGEDRYNELTDELSSKIANDELGEPERRQINITDPSDMADFLHDYLEQQGLEPHAISGSGKSRSKYFDVVANGKRRTIRIADHKLPSEYGDSDLELALYDVSPDDVRADGREMSRGIDEAEALRRAADIVDQIKQLTGTFDPQNPDIRFSRPDLNTLAASARERVGDLLTSQRTFNRWWHTTIGTQFHKAQQDRDFKKVFDLGQEYLTDTTRYAMIPEMEAPDLLLRLEKVKDALPAFLGGRKVLSKADSEAIAAPIFRGTLEDEKVYSDEELKDDFGLTDKQIDYYRQFRSAVDKSLDEMTKSVLAKMARAVGVGEDLVRRLRVSDIGLDAFYKPLVREMRARVRELQERADETTGPDKNLRLNEAAVARKQVRAVVTAYNRVRRLKADGYAPLMRFGKNTVHVQGDDGETLYFGLYESQREANAAARALEQEYPDAAVSKGILSDESYKLFNGLSPETVELFADIAGMDKAPAFQEYLRLAVNNRSALKRLMKREGTPGFSEDVSRVLAQFIVSNARTTAGNYHMGDLQKAVEDIPRRKGDVKDEAVKLWKYLTDPQEEVAWLRGYLFFNFLGGSVASALVNATQPVMMTAPYLSQFVDAAKLGKIMAQASMEAAKDAPGADVRQAYDRAMKEGVVAPHEIYQLMAQAQDSIGSGHLHRLMKGWGSFFSLAEAFNRRISFIAAYRVAVEADMANPYQFAKNAVAETQGLYNKGCVDDQTECLTAAGWKHHTDLVPGEALYAVDGEGRLVESRLVDVHRYTDGPYDATEYRNTNGLSMVLTPEHKCVVQSYNSRDQKWQDIHLVRADTVKRSNHFLRVPLGDATGVTPTYTDDEVALFAWVAAEGSLFAHRGTKVKLGVNLVQSQRHNPEYVAEIDALLDRLGGHYSRSTARSGEMVRWKLRKALWIKVHEAIPGKMLTFNLLHRLTPAQMDLFLNTFVKGDGHFPEEGGRLITQKDRGNLDVLQAMALLSGHSSTRYERMGKHDFGVLYVAKNSKRAHRKALDAAPVKLDMVWCPQTEHGTWLARRNGRTFITGNSRPNWARGPVGATIFTFKQFSISYMEFIKRLPNKQRAMALALLFLAAGAEGEPFAEDIMDVVDTIGQWMGHATNSKRWLRRTAAETLGEGAGQFVLHGVSAFLPLDISGRMGLGNLIPGTAALKTSQIEKSRDATEFLGPIGGVARSIGSAATHAGTGEYGAAVKDMMPVAVQNALKGMDMWQKGEYRDARGRKVIETTPGEAAVKAIGFQPASVARQQDKVGDNLQDVNLVRATESGIADKWAHGLADQDSDKIAEARRELIRWNANNPELRIVITSQQLKSRVQAIKSTRADRTLKTTPKELRGRVAEDLR